MTLRPSLEGVIRFVRDDMKVPVHAIADDDPTLECCFQSAMELILTIRGWSVYPSSMCERFITLPPHFS